MNARSLMIAALVGLALAGAFLFLASGDSEARPEVADPAPAREAPAVPEAEVPGEAPGEAAGDSLPATGAPARQDGDPPGAETPGPIADAPARAPGSDPSGDGSAADLPVRPTAEAAGSGQEDGAAPEILEATARAYEGLRAVRTGFDQELENTLLGRTIRSSGTLYQRQPDLFLMDFSDPEGDLIVSDGEYFWMYFPSVDPKQVLRTPRGGQGLDLRAQFVGDPVERFETTYHGRDTVRGREAHVMTLVPREELGYEKLKVWIDDTDHLVRRFELTEANGNVRHFELYDLVRNPSLPDDLFEFTPPPGSQVVTR